MPGKVEYATFNGTFDNIDTDMQELMLTFTFLCHQGVVCVDLKRDRFQALNVQMQESCSRLIGAVCHQRRSWV